jgi:hypothetical protein
LEPLQEYDFDIEYYPGTKNFIQDALSHRVDYKSPGLPRVGRKTVDKAIDDGTRNVAHTEVLMLSGVQVNG